MSQLAYEDQIAAAHTALVRARDQLQQEIADYPHPISGCDAQYIRLISDRSRIAASLRVLSEQPFVASPRALEPAA